MPIYKGVNLIGSINKGTSKIESVYKGATLVFSSGYWLDYTFNNLYNSLIPTTISSKEVKNKAKVSVVYGNSEVVNQLYPLNRIPATQTSNGITFTNNGDGSYTINGTATATTTFTQSSAVNIVKDHKYLIRLSPAGGSSTTYLGGSASGYFGADTNNGRIVTSTETSNGTTIFWRVFAGVTVNNLKCYPQFFDLTQMFPFDTPTTLDDPRVQKILNQGYIEYNEGTIKSVDISEFESARLPDIYQEVEYIESTRSQTIITNLGIFDFDCVEVIYEYTSLNQITNICGLRNANAIALSWIRNDSNYENEMQPFYGGRLITPIKHIVNTKYHIKSYAIPNEQKVYKDGVLVTTGNINFERDGYVKLSIFGLNDINNLPQFIPNAKIYSFVCYLNDLIVANFIPCYRKSDNEIGLFDTVNRVFYTNAGTGTFLKGADVDTNEHTLPFIYQGDGVGTAHDSMEITKEAYVFTRNVWNVDLSELTWSYDYLDGYGILVAATADNAQLQNNPMAVADNVSVLCISNNYIGKAIRTEMTNKTIMSGSTFLAANNLTILVKDDSVVSPNKPTGKCIYKLATPRVISIPKKHLGIIDLGTLNWIYQSQEQGGRFAAGLPTLKAQDYMSSIPNMSCSKYETQTFIAIKDKTIYCYTTGNIRNIYIKDSSYTDATAFKTAMQGQYLFYETESEVADIETQIKIEAGGTLTSDSEVLPNVTFKIKCK